MSYFCGKYPIIERKTLAKGIYSMIVDAPELAEEAQAGQFANIGVQGFTLRRPISICEIDKENGTVWQVDGYGPDGKLKKRFSITSIQRLSDGTWFFKQMKMEVRNPQNDKRTIALDYLEMDDIPKK